MSTSPDAGYSARLLIATDKGIQPIIRAALELRSVSPVLVLVGSDATFPFKPRPSTILVPGMPDGVIACVPQLDEFGVASRLASALGLPGCYDGSVIELAELWLSSMTQQLRTQTHITVSGVDSTLAEAEQLARRFDIPVASIPVLP